MLLQKHHKVKRQLQQRYYNSQAEEATQKDGAKDAPSQVVEITPNLERFSQGAAKKRFAQWKHGFRDVSCFSWLFVGTFVFCMYQLFLVQCLVTAYVTFFTKKSYYYFLYWNPLKGTVLPPIQQLKIAKALICLCSQKNINNACIHAL